MSGRRGYYPRVVALAPPPPPAEPPAPAPDQDERPQPIVGMRAIAEELGITEQQLKSMLYPSRKAHGDDSAHTPPPIRKIRGLGLAADRRTLQAWWRELLTGRAVDPDQKTA